MKVEIFRQIETHGKNLLALFPNAGIKDPVKLCKALRRCELVLNRATTDYCNLTDFDIDAASVKPMERARQLLGSARPWFNHDPRGYALKLDLDRGEVLYRDWGGYGIIAPDISKQPVAGDAK